MENKTSVHEYINTHVAQFQFRLEREKESDSLHQFPHNRKNWKKKKKDIQKHHLKTGQSGQAALHIVIKKEQMTILQLNLYQL